MVIQIKNVTLGGSGTNPYPSQYCEDDLQYFKSKDPLNIIKSGKQVNVLYNNNTVGIIGVDASGNDLHQPDDWVVLPCPPYCHRNSCEPGSKSLTLAQAIDQLSDLKPPQ